jgi:ribosomal protein S18 acetylase RimI-like enzyme
VSQPERLIHLQLTDPLKTLRGSAGTLPSGMRLRAAHLPDDLATMAELYDAVFESGDPRPATAREFADLTRHPGISPTGMFLAFAGDLAVGLAVASIDVPAPGGVVHQGAIELLAVRPAYRRQGIGRALIHAALAWLVDRGVHKVSASTENTALPDILTRYGFRRVG